MSASPVSNRPIEKVFQGPNEIAQSSSTLLRLSKLNKILSSEEIKKNREDIEKKLDDIWKKFEQTQIGSEISLAKLNQCIAQEKELLGNDLYEYFSNILNSGSLEVSQRVRKCRKDFDAAVFVTPYKHSTVGIEGPTFLIQYSRSLNHKYVVKRSDWEELLSSMIYGCFSKGFNNSNKAFGIPKFSGIDLTNGNHLSSEGALSSCSEEVKAQLESDFKQLADFAEVQIHNEEDKPILLYSELIIGENIFEFFFSKYLLLSEDGKKDLFEQLGRLALLDLFLGNMDRLIQISRNEEQEDSLYDFDGNNANLGNMMVSWSSKIEDMPRVHPIDNGVQPLNEGGRDLKYLAFIEKLFRDDDRTFSLVAQKVSESISAKLDDGDLDLKDKILDDIGVFGKLAIQNGFSEMFILMKNELVPYWEASAQANNLRIQMKKLLPELDVAIESRIELFKSVSP